MHILLNSGPFRLAAVISISVIGAVACKDQKPPEQPTTPSNSTTAEVTNVVACGPRTLPTDAEGGAAYELIDMTTKAVWVTFGFTPEQYAALEVPSSWAKNQPREATVDKLAEVRSPDCTAEGQFTEQDMFGRRFLHNVNLVSMNEPIDEAKLLTKNQVYKFQKTTFSAGRTIAILIGPDGEQFIRVSRDAGRSKDDPTLPEGWSIKQYELVKDLDVDLFEVVDNIRADNEDSFQGPLPEGADVSAHAKPTGE